MTKFKELTDVVWSLIVQTSGQTRLIAAAAVAAIVSGFIVRLMRARAARRLRAVLDIYAERQLATHAQSDAANWREHAAAFDALRKSALVMGVRR